MPGIQEVKQQFSHYLRLVEKGDHILIMRHAKPIAVIVPYDAYNTPEQRMTEEQRQEIAGAIQSLQRVQTLEEARLRAFTTEPGTALASEGSSQDK